MDRSRERILLNLWAASTITCVAYPVARLVIVQRWLAYSEVIALFFLWSLALILFLRPPLARSRGLAINAA